jgi:hypothetical protein
MRSAEIMDCRLDTSMNGEIFEDDDYAFDVIASAITGTKLDAWK